MTLIINAMRESYSKGNVQTMTVGELKAFLEDYDDDNPFFPHYYQKTKIVDGKRLRNIYLEEMPRDWMYDCLFGVANDDEIREIACQLYNTLVSLEPSGVYNEKQTITVPNTYDGGYHRETVYKKNEYVPVDVI